jgi:serine protease Do
MRLLQQMKKASSYAVAFAVGVTACAVGLKTFGDPSAYLPGGTTQSKQAVLASLNTSTPALHRGLGDSVVADAAAKVDAAVVTVHTIGKSIEQPAGAFGNDPIYRRFFGGQGGAQVTPKGAGSGVIISSDGYILTNDHVVRDTQSLTVNVGDKGYDAKVIGTDPVTDIAVVKINTGGVKLPVAQLGNSDDLRIGDWAIAVGNPLDIGTTVTLGIISAVNRTGLSAEGKHPMNSVIQTDAAINPGNSGGALANINGQVIGINEAIYSPTGSYVGIGFAIPINSAKKIAAQLIRDGKIIRPYLGVSYSALKGYPAQARRQMGITLNSDDGVLVGQVYPGSPAAEAGLKTYDVILEANRQPITDQDSLNKIIQSLKVGDSLVLRVSHNGTDRILNVTLRQRPDSFGTESPQQQDPQQQEQPQEMPFSLP